MPDRDDLLDAVLDLQHDLGKYMRQPFAFLPRNARADEVREALRMALHETRKGGLGVRTAREVWMECVAGAPRLREVPGFTEAEAAVERALAWEARLSQGEALPRAEIESDLSAVQAALSALRAAVEAT